MMDLIRTTAIVVTSVVLFILLMVFIGLFLKIAVGLALLALAYYWFTRATEQRRRRYKHWR